MVASEVFAPPTISTSGTRCGGLNGWPMTQRSGWERQADWISLIVSPDELEAIITSAGNSSSSCWYSFFLKSIRSGPFSWTRSADRTAAGRSFVNERRDCDAPAASPNRWSAGHAVFTKRLSDVSASGATSVATTSSPFARNSAVQLAPMTPVPMMAMRRMGLISDMVGSPLIGFQSFT